MRSGGGSPVFNEDALRKLRGPRKGGAKMSLDIRKKFSELRKGKPWSKARAAKGQPSIPHPNQAGRRWMIKGNEKRIVPNQETSQYLTLGWELGRKPSQKIAGKEQ